jgi:hypothetical protein
MRCLKILVLGALGALLAFGAVGCGSEDGSDPASDDQSPDSTSEAVTAVPTHCSIWVWRNTYLYTKEHQYSNYAGGPYRQVSAAWPVGTRASGGAIHPFNPDHNWSTKYWGIVLSLGGASYEYYIPANELHYTCTGH